MKTDKQIELLKEQRGNELAAKINDLDSIVVNFADTIHFLEDVEENVELVPIPIIKNGVLIVNYQEFNGFILFDTELKDDKAIINADIFNNAYNVYKWDCSLLCEMPYIFHGLHSESCNCVNFNDAAAEIYKKQKRKNEEIEKYKENEIMTACDPFKLFLKIMCWINWIMQHPEIKEVERQERTHTGKKSKKKNSINKTKMDNNTVKTVKINNIKIKTVNSKLITKIKSKKIHRIAGCWEVRGHFRHYKTGKVVYIRPYEKGKDSRNRVKKQYTI